MEEEEGLGEKMNSSLGLLKEGEAQPRLRRWQLRPLWFMLLKKLLLSLQPFKLSRLTYVVCPRVEPFVVVLIQTDPAVVSGMSWEERQEELGTIILTTKLNNL
ncbi:hypothetical protein Syun_029649 [Stephania yunnanensis]|uniref:Uncharacterized protein n=1 Tax=Stephania yunnanensis TaxID=152371 RepID=A0AAP0HLK1_9MAGN